MTGNTNTQARLSEAYQGDISEIDLWPGVLCEDPVDRNAVLGPVGAEIVARTFRNIVDGDRFWYKAIVTNRLLLNEIESSSFANVISKNTGINRE